MAKVQPRPMVRVKALADNITTLNATLVKGQVGECPPDRAKVLVAKGLAELVEGELRIPGVGEVEAGKGDRTERAVNRSATVAETQAKKG